jgi:hypothetical protein
MNAAPSPVFSLCPRCGASFTCGAAGPGPCACAGIALGAALTAQLRQQYAGCLCPDCLRALAAAEAGTGRGAGTAPPAATEPLL